MLAAQVCLLRGAGDFVNIEWGTPIVRDDLGQTLDFNLESNVNLEFDYRTFDLLAAEETSVTRFCVAGKIPK